jgi:hypothetical protein
VICRHFACARISTDFAEIALVLEPEIPDMHSWLARLTPLAFAGLLIDVALGSAGAQTRLPTQINLDNQRTATLTELTLTDAEGKAVGRITKPLSAGKKSVLKLSRGKGCDVTVSARFDDEGVVEETLDLCSEKVLRFTD